MVARSKRQTRPLVREGAPQKQDRKCQTIINILPWAPDGARHQDLLTDRPSVAMWLTLSASKSQNWDSKIWSRDPRDSDQRKTMLARASSIYKKQTRPLVRESAPQKQDRNCRRVINIWSWASDGARHQDLQIDCQSQCDFDFVSLHQDRHNFDVDFDFVVNLTRRPPFTPQEYCWYSFLLQAESTPGS
jgi:hypothetical protein